MQITHLYVIIYLLWANCTMHQPPLDLLTLILFSWIEFYVPSLQMERAIWYNSKGEGSAFATQLQQHYVIFKDGKCQMSVSKLAFMELQPPDPAGDWTASSMPAYCSPCSRAMQRLYARRVCTLSPSTGSGSSCRTTLHCHSA